MDKAFQEATEHFLRWILEKHPGESEAIPWIVTNTARKNDKRGAKAEVMIPDDWALNIKGHKELQDSYLTFRIPGELFAEYRSKKDMTESQRRVVGE